MKHTQRMLFRNSALLKPIACLTLALSAISIVPVASATTGHSPGADAIWCNGDGTAYAPIPYFPGDTLPFGINLGGNPADTWDDWGANPALVNPPGFGDKFTTEGPVSEPSMVNDVYAVQLNYWNSIVNANPLFNTKTGYGGETTLAPFGHSAGHSCLTFADTGNNHQSSFYFTITYPATASQPNQKEIDFHTNHPNDYPTFVPFVAGITSGGPTGYVSTFKGCSWDGGSCTMGSKVPTGTYIDPVTNKPAPTLPVKSTNINAFPVRLSDITSILTTWSIDADKYFGNPFNDPTLPANDRKQIWDASWDIWFDKTAHTAEGEAPYNQSSQAHDARGQNDGLEIMIWMNHNGSYVDATTGTIPQSAQGYMQPTGSIRERVFMGGTVYDVWVGRLNNPYFGYVAGSMVNGKVAPQIITPDKAPGECPTTIGRGINGAPGTPNEAILCGVEWNVVSFVATNTHDPRGNSDYRKKSKAIDAKMFTDYILGNVTPRGPNGGDWNIMMVDNGDGLGLHATTGQTRKTPLQCPASNKDQSLNGGVFGTINCLDPSWFLTSIQAGFETWSGGNGLTSKNFTAYVNTAPNAYNTYIVNSQGHPVIGSTAAFNVVYSGCNGSTSPNNHVTFTITGKGAGGASASYGSIDMGAQQANGQFVTTVNDPNFPVIGDAVIHFTSVCGNVDVPVFIDPSGRVFYSDGVTPIEGATVTLQYSTSGNQSGSFADVPNLNGGGSMGAVIMQPNDNIYNPMRSSVQGIYGWNVIPGWYKVTAAYNGVSVTTAAQQVTATHPITNLNLVLPVAAPPPVVVSSTTPGVTVALTLNGADWAHGYCRNVVLKNTNSYAVTWNVQFTLPFAGQIDPNNNWNLTYTQSGSTVTASGSGWNNVLQPGQILNSSGFCASK